MPGLTNAERERQYKVARQQRLTLKEKPQSRTRATLFGLLLFFVLGVAGAVLLLRPRGK